MRALPEARRSPLTVPRSLKTPTEKTGIFRLIEEPRNLLTLRANRIRLGV